MEHEACNYFEWIQRHRRFRRANPAASAERRKRPLRFAEEQGIETALRPHLYWDLSMCETSCRLADVRRKSRAGAQRANDLDSDGEGEEAESSGRQSLKRSFLQKAMGPVAEYAGEYELLHFVFDLSTWSDIGGKKGALHGMPMWQVMKGAAWTPQFWKVRHAAALGMQSQRLPRGLLDLGAVRMVRALS